MKFHTVLLGVIQILMKLHEGWCFPSDCRNGNTLNTMCCDIPLNFMGLEYSNECELIIRDKWNQLNPFIENLCLQDCMFHKTDIYVNGVLNLEHFDNLINANFNASTIWRPLLHVSFDYCATEALHHEDDLLPILNLKPYFLNETDCNIVPAYIVKCMKVYITKACPKQVWITTRECDEFKTYLEFCPEQFLSESL